MGSHWNLHRVIGNLQVNEFTAGIMESTDKIKQLSGRVIIASGGMTILSSVLAGYLWDSVLL